MPVPWLPQLSLPVEFLLLSHQESGEVPRRHQVELGCAAAELGDLALRRNLVVRPRKTRFFGLEVYNYNGGIELLDPARTGSPWADELLGELEQLRGEHQRPKLFRWLRKHRHRFERHRAEMARQGWLRYERGKRSERYYPDPVAREALVARLGAAGNGRVQLDEHMLFLTDLVRACELEDTFGIQRTTRQRLDRARGQGDVAHFPEDLRDTSTALYGAIPYRTGGGSGGV